MDRPRLLIFDLDDTLYAERTYVESGYRHVARWVSARIGVDEEEIDAFLRSDLERYGRGHNFDRLLARYRGATSRLTVPQLVETYQTHRPSIALSPEVRSLLARLGKEFALALLTDGWARVQKRKVDALGLEVYFPCVVFAQAPGLAYRKPHPRGFEAVLAHFRAAPEESLMIGDNEERDVHGARRLGMHAFLVRTTLEDLDEQRRLLKILGVGVTERDTFPRESSI